VCPSILQWLKWLLGSLHCCVVVVVFLFFPSFHFFFPSLEASWFSFYLEPLGYPFLWPMFSRYCACTHASSTILGLKSFTCFRRWICRPPRYTMPLLFPKVVSLDPLVLYIPDKVELGLDEGFEFLPPSYWRITL
jgi:hypothetical protein